MISGFLKALVALVFLVGTMVLSVCAYSASLPLRQGERPRTTEGVPHVQIDAVAKPALSADLLRQVDAFPGVEIKETVISLPGANGFWINESVDLKRPESIVGGREFAHMHPDGSLHASLSPELADEAIKAGWAVRHPWSRMRPGWEGFVLIYTPTTETELKVVVGLVAASYAFVTGQPFYDN